MCAKKVYVDPCTDLSFSEEDGYRYLHFGSPWIQGAMKVSRPYELALEYPRQMMSCGLFYPNPKHILQLGLGAASLTKFCYRYTDAQVDVVEVSETVIAAARQWFKLPYDDERLTVIWPTPKNSSAIVAAMSPPTGCKSTFMMPKPKAPFMTTWSSTRCVVVR